ncbi:MAG: PfkB family carbohydrate kinase, partial [Gammaproteobacteria bacterium]
MTALICGSLAYDNIMVFQDRFKNHILPHRIHILNVCFLVPEMRREFGGCAGNIAYNLKLLGADALPVATVGRDFDAYAAWLDACGISRRHVKTIADQWTAQAFITTDLDDNQITAFHPGAMSHSHHNALPALDGVRLAIISPDGREGMLEHTAALAEAKVPIIFDPGQGLPMFEKEELLWFLSRATYVT